MKTLLTSIALALWFPLLLMAQPADPRDVVWYPNPATQEQDIHLKLETPGELDIHIYRADGERIHRLLLGRESAPHHLLFRAGELASGSYFARILSSEGGTQRVVHFIVQ